DTRPVATPETRPTTVPGWTVREIVGGNIVLEGPNGISQVARGDLVPGLGRVDSVVRWGNRWIVVTSRGLVSTQWAEHSDRPELLRPLGLLCGLVPVAPSSALADSRNKMIRRSAFAPATHSTTMTVDTIMVQAIGS